LWDGRRPGADPESAKVAGALGRGELARPASGGSGGFAAEPGGAGGLLSARGAGFPG
jgi:hypothetical protein